MNRKTVTAMFGAKPLIGLLMGINVVIVILLNEAYFGYSPLLLAIVVVVLNILMTGGLHLDGWIDLGDAFFSYRDKEKRLEILSDSRVGAFGAIHLAVLLLLKTGILYEIFFRQPLNMHLFFLFVPFLCRMAMLIYFNCSMNVKETGLAAYYKKHVQTGALWIYIGCYLLLFLTAAFLLKEVLLLVLLVSMIILTFIYRKWTYVHFGGMTGDLLGALYEGMELALWGILLLFI